VTHPAGGKIPGSYPATSPVPPTHTPASPTPMRRKISRSRAATTRTSGAAGKRLQPRPHRRRPTRRGTPAHRAM